MKSKFAFVTDIIFSALIIFIVTFLWVRFLNNNIVFELVFTFLITFVSIIIMVFSQDRKRSRLFTKKEEIKNIENLFNQMIFLNHNELLKFVKENSDFDFEEENDILSFVENNIKYHIILKVELKKILVQDYIELVKNFNQDNIIVVSSSEDYDAKDFRTKLKKNIIFMDIHSFYRKFFPKKEFYPPILFKEEAKKSKDEYLKLFFNKKRSKNYFNLCMLFSLYGFIFKTNIYFLFFSLLTGVFSLYSAKNKKYNSDENSFIFDFQEKK